MTSSDKLNQNSTEKKGENSDAPNSKNSSPNSGMMGGTAVLAAATILMKMGYLLVIPLNLMKEGS